MCWICGKLVELETCKTDEHQAKRRKMAKTPAPRASDDSMPELTYPEWQKPYRAALLETDHSRLKQKILDAEAAILKRRQELSRGAPDAGLSLRDGAAPHAELMEIGDALSTLNTLRNELQKGAPQE
jgi:hypothetical protein